MPKRTLKNVPKRQLRLKIPLLKDELRPVSSRRAEVGVFLPLADVL